MLKKKHNFTNELSLGERKVTEIEIEIETEKEPRAVLAYKYEGRLKMAKDARFSDTQLGQTVWEPRRDNAVGKRAKVIPALSVHRRGFRFDRGREMKQAGGGNR